MKLSKIQQIIKEEVAKAVKENSSNYATKVGLAIKADAKGKSENEIIKLISDYLKQDGNTPTERSNLMNSDYFIPDVLYTIKHSGTEDKNLELNDKFKAAVGFQKPAPGGPENKLKSIEEKNTKTEKFTFEYDYFGKDGDTHQDEVTVDATSEKDARDLAYKKAGQKHTQIRTKKENFRPIK